jgi:uncharacterized DUF497 family protein
MYEWDDGKEAVNRAKHAIGFAAIAKFNWSSAIFEIDDRYDYGEVRYRAYGLIDDQPHCVAFTFRGANVRVISLRRMHLKEARKYGLKIKQA